MEDEERGNMETILLSDSSRRKQTQLQAFGSFPLLWKVLFISLTVAFLVTLSIAIFASVESSRKTQNGSTDGGVDSICTKGDDLASMSSASAGLYADNRVRFFSVASLVFGSEDVLYFEGGTSSIRNDDVELLFRQTSDFLYLTGVTYPDASLLLDMNEQKSILFMPDKDTYDAVWIGKIETLAEFKAKFDIDEVYFQSNFSEVLESLNPATVWTYPGQTLPDNSTNAHVNSSIEFIRALWDARTVKTPKEIEVMRLVAEVSSAGHVSLMERCIPGMYEYHLESLFLYENYNCGLRQQAYIPIVGSGYNAAVLHYSVNERKMQNGDFVLIDAGAEFSGYGTDITRTFPVSGIWLSTQKDIYQVVLNSQKLAIEMLKPGVKWMDVVHASRREMCLGLIQLGLLTGDIEDVLDNKLYVVFMPHGLGHYVGLDVHDTYSLPTDLEPGMILTVEPGIYFNDVSFDLGFADETQAPYLNRAVIEQYMHVGGVRIEDTILITEESYEVLSRWAPKEIEDIEIVMNPSEVHPH